MNFPPKLQKKIDERISNDALRSLGVSGTGIDFFSNDYLGFSKSEKIFNQTHDYLVQNSFFQNGATGSRLLSGNHQLYEILENQLSEFYNSEAALVFNSGYDANLGFFSCVPQRNDIIIYDEFSHASIRDGIGMSLAKSFKFKHNDLNDLEMMLNKFENQTVFVVTETVFSMDGDTPNLIKLSQICEKYQAYLVVDEAHAVGVFGENGAGLIKEFNLENKVFARIITFGKAIGSHGAAVLCNRDLKQYLVNFSRSFIYTTALSPHSLASILTAHQILKEENLFSKLFENIKIFKEEIKNNQLELFFIESNSAIQCAVFSGNEKVKSISKTLINKGFNVKPILSPTVPLGKERLRFCLHSFNKTEEIAEVLKLLKAQL